jgi:hypothetical protein
MWKKILLFLAILLIIPMPKIINGVYKWTVARYKWEVLKIEVSKRGAKYSNFMNCLQNPNKYKWTDEDDKLMQQRHDAVDRVSRMIEKHENGCAKECGLSEKEVSEILYPEAAKLDEYWRRNDRQYREWREKNQGK